MIVKVEVEGAYVRIHSQDNKVAMTTVATKALLARMNGRTKAFFDAKVEQGGGKKNWGQGEVEYANPSETIEIDAALPDQGW